MRTLKELYVIIAEEYKKRKNYGICVVISQAFFDEIITYEERTILLNDLNGRFPTIFSFEFFNPAFRQLIASKGGYWWANNSYGDKRRDKFLQKIINKL